MKNNRFVPPLHEKSLKNSLAIGFLATLGLLSFTAPANAASISNFNLNFDNTFDNTLSAPFVGTGTFSFDDIVPDDIYNLTSLPNYNFNINFGATNFTNANITTTASTVLVIISGSGTDIRFANTSPFPDGGYSGAIDFVNGANFLSIEPPSFGQNPTTYAASVNSTNYSGNYTGPAPTAVPFEFEPTGAVVILGGLWGLKRLANKKRQA